MTFSILTNMQLNQLCSLRCTVLLAFTFWAFAPAMAGLKVDGLKCEYRTTPLGLDAPQPRLSWLLDSRQRGEVQTAYQVLAASSLARLSNGKADLWDSGKVASSQSLGVVYAGKPLSSGQRVYWKVRAWNRAQAPSSYSQSSWWELGLLRPEDWRASWIAAPQEGPMPEEKMFDDHPAPLFRKEFRLAKQVKRARLYVSGLGYYELRLNGRRVGDQVLDPGWTSYARRVLYSTYDVTQQLKGGANALGVMLGNGWYNPLPLRMWGWLDIRQTLSVGQPRLRLQLVLEYADGAVETIASDPSWKAGDGPILRNSVYLGELYDARKEQPGWDRPGFDDSKWVQASLALEPLGILSAQDVPPIRVTRTLAPVKITEPRPGVRIFDFGQNFAGWVRICLEGPAGTHVRLRYGELLYPDGSLNGMTSVCGQIKQGGPNYRYPGTGAPKTAWQMDEYVLKGEGREVYTPRFTFHGFRYVELTAVPAALVISKASMEGLRLNSDVAAAGSFSCSNEQFNRIQRMVLWTELSNLFSVESDCPHREKFGYGGDMVAASEMGILNFDLARFYAKAVQDLGDAVRPNGGFTETAPFVGIDSDGLGGGAGPIGWGTGHPFLQWQLYQYYGDLRVLAEQYENTKRWVALLQSRAQDGILDNGISDHESLAPKPRALTGTGFYYLNVVLFARIARALGHEADALEADALAEKIKTAFNRTFLQPQTGRYDSATQACQAFALCLGLVPPEERERALGVLVQDIVSGHQGHLTTGIFGTKFMLESLADLGRSDVAYQMVNQRTFPGWGHMLERGATTLWEHWEFSDNTYSHNHPMFGSVSEWFYKALGGLNLAPDAVGCDKLVVKPQLVGDLQWVKASYDSVHGKVISEWSRHGTKVMLHIRVPVGVSATVFVPAAKGARLSEGGRPLERVKGIQLLRREGGCVLLGVGAGDYRFSAK
jgi:alpha-L-rhamnosidase